MLQESCNNAAIIRCMCGWLVGFDGFIDFVLCSVVPAFLQHPCSVINVSDLFVSYFEQHCMTVRAAYMQHFSMSHCPHIPS